MAFPSLRSTLSSELVEEEEEEEVGVEEVVEGAGNVKKGKQAEVRSTERLRRVTRVARGVMRSVMGVT